MSNLDASKYQVQEDELEQPENTSHRLELNEVRFSSQARLTLREATQKIAEYCQLPPEILDKRLDQKLFWLKPSGMLQITIEVPELDADMFIEIPPGHWWIDDSAYQA